MRILLATLLVTLTLTACSGATESDDAATATLNPETAVVTVGYRDSSVPPEYHRSWQLTLDSDEIAVVVDSYGDVVSEGHEAMPEEEWRDFVAELPAAVEDLPEPAPDEAGCTGGTAIALTVDGSWSEEVNVSNCANDGNAVITDRITALVEPFTEVVDLDERLETD